MQVSSTGVPYPNGQRGSLAVLVETRDWKWKLFPTLCDPMDCSPPGSSVHGILQARILEWVAIPFSRGSSTPRDQTQVSCIADFEPPRSKSILKPFILFLDRHLAAAWGLTPLGDVTAGNRSRTRQTNKRQTPQGTEGNKVNHSQVKH